MIPVHPEPGPDPATLLWHMPAGTLPVVGPVTHVPEPLRDLLAAGVVAHVVAADAHVQVTLGDAHDWRTDGARVRTALLTALERPGEWAAAGTVYDGEGEPGPGPGPGPEVADDDALYDAALAAVRGQVGELARSHGGAIELDSVADGVVTVRMRGACHGCPAAELTLHARLERTLRESFPALREVRSAGPGSRRAPTWLLLGRRAGES